VIFIYMKKIKCLTHSLFLLALMSCFNINSSASEKKIERQFSDNQEIVLIFYKNTLLKDHKKNTFFTTNRIKYYNEQMLLNEIELNNRLKNDTITISTKKEFLPVDLFNNYIVYNYHFRNGDTILFKFQNDIPVVEDKINTPYYDLNYTLEYKKRFLKPLKGDNILRMSKDTLTTYAKFQNLEKNYNAQQLFLDSLENANKMSSQVVVFFKNQNNFEFYSQAIINPAFSAYLVKLPNGLDFNKMINDSQYFNNGYFHYFLIWQYLWSQKLNIKHVKHSQGISLDYKQAYQISKEIFSNKALKEAMLLYCLQMIKQEEPIAIFKSYQKIFKEDVSEKFYQAYLADNFTAKIDTKPGSSILIDQSKIKKIDFNQLIKSLSGQVVYIDLWASWCMPCRVSMPDSHKLKNSFKGKPVTFVYLSLDENFSNWKKASKEDGILTDENSFLLINPKEAALTKQINLKSIPRYLLFDKKGKLIHQNAPGPSSGELITLIDGCLIE